MVPGAAGLEGGGAPPGETLAAFEGDEDVSAVVTECGKTVEGDFVVVGAGVKPDTMLAKRAGLDDGRAGSSATRGCRPRWRGSTPPGTCAATTAWCTGGGCGWSTGTWRCSRGARGEGACWGRPTPYDVVPYFFSDLADWASTRVRRPGDRLGRGDLARRPRRGRVRRLLPRRTERWPAASAVDRSEDLGRRPRAAGGGRRRVGIEGRAGGRGQRPSELVSLSSLASSPPRTVGPGVMATRHSLEVEFGVRVPGAQFAASCL